MADFAAKPTTRCGFVAIEGHGSGEYTFCGSGTVVDKQSPLICYFGKECIYG